MKSLLGVFNHLVYQFMPLLADCKKADALFNQKQMPEGAC